MKEGYVLHTFSKEKDGWHTLRRVDNKRGVVVEYGDDQPLKGEIPVSEAAQLEAAENYHTEIGGERFEGLIGVVGRAGIREIETLFGGIKADLPDNGTLDDNEVIRARVMAWTPWQGNGKRQKRAVTVSKSKMEGLTDAEKVEYLMAQGVVYTD